MKKLAVVVLNFNDYDNTLRYVSQIKEYKSINLIIIVDNSDNERFSELKKIESLKIKVIKSEKNEGYANGNNMALRYLNDNFKDIEYIAISNPDVEVPEESYNKCLEYLEKEENSKVAVVAPRMIDKNNNPHQLSGWRLRTLRGDIMDSSVLITRKINKPHIERYGEYLEENDEVKVDCVAGSFFIIRNEVFKEIGYFDEKTFLYYEEDILGKKLKNIGYELTVLNTCKFKHFEAVSVQRNMKYIKKYKIMQKSKRYYHKVYNKKQWYKLILLDLVTLLGIIEIFCENNKIFKFIKRVKNKIFKIKKYFKFDKNNKINKINKINIIKALLYFYTIISWPIYIISKNIRRTKKILYFSIVDWKWIKQRPHFIPLEISKYKKYKVDYRFQALKNTHSNVSQFQVVENKVEKNKKLRILPFIIFPELSISSFKLRNIIRTSFWNYGTIILTQPNQIDFFILKIHKLRGTKIIYECMDNYEMWENNKEEYRNKEKKLLYFADEVVVTANKLKTRLEELYNIKSKNITIIRNAYDKELFEKPVVQTNLKLDHPNITYIGTVDDWFDFDSICDLATKNNNININIIGPVAVKLNEKIEKIKEQYKNIIFKGPIEHDLVPLYISESDILMMPFIVNKIIESVDPVKVYEYLCYKKPVISSYWEELNQFDGMLYFYNPVNSNFAEKVNEAIIDGFKETNKYKSVVLDSTWENRIKEYIKLL